MKCNQSESNSIEYSIQFHINSDFDSKPRTKYQGHACGRRGGNARSDLVHTIAALRVAVMFYFDLALAWL